MKKVEGKLEFSITDIVRFFRSPYSSWATWANLEYPGTVFLEKDMVQNSSLLLRSEKNEDDAKKYLINNYESVKQIQNPLNSEVESKELISSKADVIVQPTLRRENFIGRADFLIRNKENNLYEVMDAKLAKQVKPEFLLQVCGYSWMLEEYQNSIPQKGWFFLGNQQVESFKLFEYYKFFIDLKEKFLDEVSNYSIDEHPTPRKWEVFEEFNDAANKYWQDNDALELIADISSRQIDILEKSNIKTVNQLIEFDEEYLQKIPHQTLDKIKRQASAQKKSNKDFTHIELRNDDESVHWLHTLLPDEQPGDIYFDLEGYPFYNFRTEDTLEYLYGVAYKDESGELVFKDDLWAESELEEKYIFDQFVNWVEDRINKFPSLKIYHYAHYEKTSLLKSSQKFGLHEITIDKWIKDGRLVDLYQIIRKAFIIGKDSYSLKRIEEIPGYKRELDLNSGIDSIFYFEKYLSTNNEDIKNEILMYNMDDCFATEAVCVWLRSMKESYPYTFEYQEKEPTEPTEEDIEIQNYEELINNLDSETVSEESKNFMSTILGYYRREKKADFWELFNLLDLPIEEKVYNASSFAYLKLIEKPELLDGYYRLSYECLDNTFKKVKQGDEIILLVATNNSYEDVQFYATVSEITDDPFVLTFDISEKQWKSKHEYDSSVVFSFDSASAIVNPVPAKFGKVADSPFKALKNICDQFIETKNLPEIINEILEKKPSTDISIANSTNPSSEDIYKICIKMQGSYLAIQGPPGTGKSTMLGEVIAKLYHDGYKVGLAAPNYASSLNLAKKVSYYLNEGEVIDFLGGSEEIKKEIEENEHIRSATDSQSNKSNLLSTFINRICHKRYEDQFDFIVIDEVGQVPLATTLAATQATKNLVLIGDPQQLPQVKKGSHPNNNGFTTLEYLVGEGVTIQKELGVFLDKTYRLHPTINSFISTFFYDNRLLNDNFTSKRFLNSYKKPLVPSGIQFINVDHEGNTQASFEEIDALEDIIENLLTSEINLGSQIRKLVEEDILIVSPYNLQVYEIGKRLGEKFRVGTVDKFQGQEAPVVIVSLAASNYEDAPRGIDFILNYNRMNVALSRAQCLSIVIGSPKLTNLHYQSLNSIKLSNFHRTLIDPSSLIL